MFGLVPFGSKNDVVRKEDAFGRLLDIFNEPFFNSALTPLQRMGGMASFRVDVKDEGNAYELTAELPGVNKEDISLSYENSYLTIKTKQCSEQEEKEETGKYIRRERSYGAASRSFYIEGIDEAGTEAEFKDGVLRVRLPKTGEEPKLKQIEIH